MLAARSYRPPPEATRCDRDLDIEDNRAGEAAAACFVSATKRINGPKLCAAAGSGGQPPTTGTRRSVPDNRADEVVFSARSIAVRGGSGFGQLEDALNHPLELSGGHCAPARQAETGSELPLGGSIDASRRVGKNGLQVHGLPC